MLKQTVISGFLGLSLIACGGNNAPVAPANTTANAPAPTNATNVAPTNTSTLPANAATAAKPAPSAPKRLNFPKGTSNVVEYFDLDIGESKQFVVGAAKGQDFTIGNGGDLKITMLTKGKMVDETNDSTSYNGTTTAGGDFIFQVTNTAKKKNKSSVNVMIQTIGDD